MTAYRTNVPAVNLVGPAPTSFGAIEQVLIKGDLASLTPEQRVVYYNKVCETVGLNPLTRPFDYITLNGKLVLYANKGCAEQLRAVHKISIRVVSREKIEDVYVVTAEAANADSRVDSSTGAVTVSGLKGESLANAMMKAETKAKRRVTLSICGLNMLDITEVDTIPGAQRPTVYADQPTAQDGGGKPNGALIPNGQWAKYRAAELPEPELRKLIEKLEHEPSLDHDGLRCLEQCREALITLQNMEPDDFESVEPQKIRCECGSDLKYSERKGVYYCPSFKQAGDHIPPVPKAKYEAAS